MNILVTGAAGFIGSHVAEALLKRGGTVVGIDDLNDYYPPEYKQENIEILQKYERFTFIRGDIRDHGLMRDIFKEHGITHVGHLAARAGVRASVEDPFLYQDVNVRGTLVLLECAKESSTENFVLTSSSSVYGYSTKVPFTEDDSATDLPISPYAATKKATEVMGHAYHYLHGLNISVVRPFTVFGPRGRPDMVMWKFIQAVCNDQAITRYGDGSSRRDYTYISDFVAGFVAALDRPLGYEVFNLGSEHPVMMNDLIAILEEITGKSIKVKEESMPKADVPITYADLTKAKRLLGYEPKKPFKEAVREFYAWFMQNRA